MSEAWKKFVSIYISVTIILFVIRCWLALDDINMMVIGKHFMECSYNLYSYAGEAVFGSGIFMMLFDKWLWKLKYFHFLSSEVPVLSNRYKGTLVYCWNGVKNCRESEIIIKQTFLSVSVKLGTIESHSNSITAVIENVNNEKQLIYTFINTPKAELQDGSAIHFGTAMLCIDDPKRIRGNYYTSRLTRGSMDFIAVSDQ